MTFADKLKANYKEREKVKQQIKKDIQVEAKKVIEARQTQTDESTRTA